MRREQLVWPIVLCALATWYLTLAPHHMLGGDNAEFVVLAALDGVAHPPGYPLYTSLLAGLHGVPLDAPFKAALLSIGCGIATLALTRSMLMRFGMHLASATVATLALAVAPLFVSLVTQAEVFALHALLIVAVLWLCAPQTTSRAAALGLPFVFGCGFAHHQTLVWLVPLALPVYVRAIASRLSWLPLGVGAFVLPVLLYLRLPGLADASARIQLPVLADLSSTYGLYEFVARKQYGTFSLASAHAQVPFAFEVTKLAQTLAHNLTWFGVALAVLGLVKRFSWGLLIAWLGCGVVFVSLAGLPAEGPAREVMSRFHLMPLIVTLPWLAFGLDAVLAHWMRLLFAGLIALTAIVTDAEVREHHTPSIEHMLRTQLAAAPPNAVIIAGDDASGFGFRYLQNVLGERPDVTTFGIGYLHSPRYRMNLAQRLRLPFIAPAVGEALATLRAGHRVFFAYEPPREIGEVAPLSGLWQIDEPFLDPLTVEASCLEAFGDVLLVDEVEHNPERWAFLVTRNYARQLAWLSEAFESLGREDVAYLYRSWSDGLLAPVI